MIIWYHITISFCIKITQIIPMEFRFFPHAEMHSAWGHWQRCSDCFWCKARMLAQNLNALDADSTTVNHSCYPHPFARQFHNECRKNVSETLSVFLTSFSHPDFPALPGAFSLESDVFCEETLYSIAHGISSVLTDAFCAEIKIISHSNFAGYRLSLIHISFEQHYRQLAYAMNDPMEHCTYNSDTIFQIFYGESEPVSDYYVVAAALRN